MGGSGVRRSRVSQTPKLPVIETVVHAPNPPDPSPPGPKFSSQDGGAQAAAPPPFTSLLAGRWTADGRVPLAFPDSGPPHLDPLTSKRLEPADATTSSLESRTRTRVCAENRKRKYAAESARPSWCLSTSGRVLYCPKAGVGLKFVGASLGSDSGQGDTWSRFARTGEGAWRESQRSGTGAQLIEAPSLWGDTVSCGDSLGTWGTSERGVTSRS